LDLKDLEELEDNELEIPFWKMSEAFVSIHCSENIDRDLDVINNKIT